MHTFPGEVSAEEKARRKAEERTRTVYFFGCSPDLKTLWNQFPDAEQISFNQRVANYLQGFI